MYLYCASNFIFCCLNMLLEFYPIFYDYFKVSSIFNSVYKGVGLIYGNLTYSVIYLLLYFFII